MDQNSKYILIAEDDEDDRMLLEAAFLETSDEIKLVFVGDGVELTEHFAKIEKESPESFPSLLILDLNMPKKNGKEVLAELYEKDYYTHFKTVIFSTTSCESERGKCHDYGIADYIVKPTGYKALLDIVTRFRTLAGFPEKALH